MCTTLRNAALVAWLAFFALTIGARAQRPQSEAILFVSNHADEESTFYLMNSHGSQLREFLPGIRTPAAPMWSRNGRQIAFVLYPPWPDPGAVHVVNSDGSGLRALAPEGELSWGPAWSPRSDKVAYTARSGIRNIHIADVRGNERPKVITNRVDPAGGWRPSVSPTWAPNGERIAFVAYKHNNQHSPRYIWTMAPDGSDMRELVVHESRNTGPSYSPNGKRIVFVSDRDGASEVYTVGSDGAGLRRVTGLGRARRPRWSPDGKRIVFFTNPEVWPGANDIHVIDATGRNHKQLTDFGARSTYPDWFDPTAEVSAAARQLLMWGWLKRTGGAL